MAESTGIEWTHHTWSPWWGCTKVSDGCKHCYADTHSHRWGFNIWGPSAPRRFFGLKHWNDPIRWNRAAEKAGERRRVFPSMCDPFEDRPDLEEPRRRMFELIDATPWLDWLLVTKRPENIRRMWPHGWGTAATLDAAPDTDFIRGERPSCRRANVWLLTSVENQPSADQRIPELARCADLAPVRGVSAEPLLGPVDLFDVDGAINQTIGRNGKNGTLYSAEIINWVIVGGESQHGARPMHPDWARSLRDDCQSAEVPFFFKQWGDWLPFELDAQPPFFNGQDGSFIDGHCFPDNIADAHDEPIDGWRYDLGDREENPVVWRHVGKKKAGNKLDRREWQQFPKAVPA